MERKAMTELDQFFEIYPNLPGATIPLGVCVDGLVYANGLAGIDLVTGVPADGLEAQIHLALAHLRMLMENAGGSIDEIGRGVAYVTKAEDRNAVYGPWEAMFPDAQDRPAFKVLVGSLPPGHLVQFDGLAILGQRRKRTEIDGVPAHDPTVRIGDWVFTSRVHGIVPHGGVPEDTEAEAIQNFENIAALLKLNGCTARDLVQLTLFGNSADYFDAAQKAYEHVFPDAQTRPPLHRLITFVTPRFKISVEMIAMRGADRPQSRFREVFLCQDRRPIPDGARLGPLLVASGLTAADPCTSALAAADPAAQLRAALTNMETFLAQGGANRNHLARATFHMPSVDDRTVLNQVWSEHFPDPSARPPHKYAPAKLPQGHRVRLQILAVPDAGARRTLDIPGLQHMDPMAMGACTGNLVTSSRLFGTRAFSGEVVRSAAEASEIAFAHAGTLLQRAGTDWSHVTQLTAFIGDQAQAGIVEAELKRALGGARAAPRLNIVVASWAGNSTPRIEIVAVI